MNSSRNKLESISWVTLSREIPAIIMSQWKNYFKSKSFMSRKK